MNLFSDADLAGGQLALPATTGTGDPLEPFLVDHPEWKAKFHVDTPFPPDPGRFSKESLQQMPGMEWLAGVECILYYPYDASPERQAAQLEQFLMELRAECTILPAGFCPTFPSDYNEPLIALDTETTGLDLRTLYDEDGNLKHKTVPVGLCLATSENKGYYLPIRHTEADGVPNWNWEALIPFIDELQQRFANIVHNGGYDREVLSLNGVSKLRPYPYFFDTQVLDFFYDVNNKSHGLKPASASRLNRKMIEISELFGSGGKKNVHIEFDRLPATTAVVYGCSDAMNTFGLFKFFAGQAQSDNMFQHQAIPLQIDHKIVDVIRNFTRSGLPINYRYFYYAAMDTIHRVNLVEQAIYQLVGRRFNIGSPKELSNLLFDEYKIPPLDGMEKGKNHCYSTAEDVLDQLFEKFPDFLILRYIVTYRKLNATLAKIYVKAITNSFVDSLQPYTRMQLSFNQTLIPTGRLVSSSSDSRERVTVKVSDKTKKVSYTYDKGSWDCGMNSQGIPAPAYERQKARRITKIPAALGLDANKSLYPDWVRDELVKTAAQI